MTARAEFPPKPRPLARPGISHRCSCAAGNVRDLWSYCPRADVIYCAFCGKPYTEHLPAPERPQQPHGFTDHF